jgi:hypothetical protein
MKSQSHSIFKGGFTGVVGAILANEFCKTMAVIGLVNAPFAGIAAIWV